MLTEKQKEALLNKKNIVVQENESKPKKDGYLVASVKDLGLVVVLPARAFFYPLVTAPWRTKKTFENEAFRGSIVRNAGGLIVSAFKVAASNLCGAGFAFCLYGLATSGATFGGVLATIALGAFAAGASAICHENDMENLGYDKLKNQPKWPWQKPPAQPAEAPGHW